MRFVMFPTRPQLRPPLYALSMILLKNMTFVKMTILYVSIQSIVCILKMMFRVRFVEGFRKIYRLRMFICYFSKASSENKI